MQHKFFSHISSKIKKGIAPQSGILRGTLSESMSETKFMLSERGMTAPATENEKRIYSLTCYKPADAWETAAG